MEIHFTAHHNWEWVLREALDELARERGASKSCKLSRAKELHSVQRGTESAKALIKQYALFRAEYVSESEGTATKSAWATSEAFGFLDAKDALYRNLSLNGVADLMPMTQLLPWNCGIDQDLNYTGENVASLPSEPALLKAALGSGGFGLYFVQNATDVQQLVRAHALRATAYPDFLESLKKRYDGQVPEWSLQSLINISRLDGDKRCQIRVYVVSCGDRLYMYKNFEVRVPTWDTDLDSNIGVHHTSSSHAASIPPSNSYSTQGSDEKLVDTNLSVEDFDEICCAGTTARPYNKDRNKKVTNRFTLDELEQLRGEREAIALCVRTAMKALEPSIREALAKDKLPPPTPGTVTDTADTADTAGEHTSASSTFTQLAIAGIDLVIGVPYGQKDVDSTSTNYNVDCRELVVTGTTNASAAENNKSDEGAPPAPGAPAAAVISTYSPRTNPLLLLTMFSSLRKLFITATTRVTGILSSSLSFLFAFAATGGSFKTHHHKHKEQLPPASPPVVAAAEEKRRTSRPRPYILEINHNPAMPSPGKLMSDKYREHLVTFVKSTVDLGLSDGENDALFEKIW